MWTLTIGWSQEELCTTLGFCYIIIVLQAFPSSCAFHLRMFCTLCTQSVVVASLKRDPTFSMIAICHKNGKDLEPAYLQDDWEEGASEAKKNSASLWTLPSRKTNKSSSISWWLAKVLGGSLCPRPTEDRWLRFCFTNSWSSLTLYSPALRLLLGMETNHYCMEENIWIDWAYWSLIVAICRVEYNEE
jgi:hypothetical protein